MQGLSRLRNWALIFLILLGIGVRQSYPALIWGSLLALTLLVISFLWSFFALRRLELEAELSRNPITAGEETEFVLTLENRKPLPVFWLKVFCYFSGGIKFRESGYLENVPGNRQFFQDSVRLNWYQRVRRSYALAPAHRGRYRMDRSAFSYDGFLGLFSREQGADSALELMVYPRLYPVLGGDFLARRPRGEKMTRGWIFTDRSNIVGVRDYQSGDDFKRINWKVTARHNELKSDIYNPTLQKQVEIVLDVRTTDYRWEGFAPRRLEGLISAAGSLSRHFLRRDYAVGIISNGVRRGGGDMRVEPGQSEGQLEEILKNLASLQPIFRRGVEELAPRLKGEAEIIILSSRPGLMADSADRFPARPHLLIQDEPGEDPGEVPTGFRPYRCSFSGGENDGCFSIEALTDHK